MSTLSHHLSLLFNLLRTQLNIFLTIHIPLILWDNPHYRGVYKHVSKCVQYNALWNTKIANY